jgi:hypothetical protein
MERNRAGNIDIIGFGAYVIPRKSLSLVMNEQAELLSEIRDLLRLIAEPALAKRDEGRRAALRALAGRSKTNTKAIQLMDGTRTRKAIRQESGIDAGNLSRLEKSLRDKELITADEQLKLVITIPANFFESTEE